MAIEGARAAAIFRHWVLFGLPQMSMLRNASANRLFKQASAALVYLGIVTTFVVVSSIVCVIWLLIW